MSEHSSLMQGELDLFASHPARTGFDLEELLNQGLPLPVRVKITRNQVSMVSIRFKQDHTLCRLHEAFLSAPPDILRSLRRYLQHRRTRDWAPVADFAQAIEIQATQPADTHTQGKHYDLAALLACVNRAWFNNEIDVAISWGRQPPRKKGGRHFSIHFGSYTASANLIRIHPRLDEPDVPEAFVQFVIYHEILHMVHPPYRRNGRWVFHSPEFKEAEQRFPAFEQMQEQAAHILQEIQLACT